jgi:hypothetical protein
MNRNLLKSLFVTLVLVFTAIAAQAQCYIIGNDGKWLTNEAGAELQPTTEDGVCYLCLILLVIRLAYFRR